jgi:hypothetical protein
MKEYVFVSYFYINSKKEDDLTSVSYLHAGPITKPPLLQRSRLTGGGSPNLVGLVERKAL